MKKSTAAVSSVAALAQVVSQAAGITQKQKLGPTGRPLIEGIYDRRDGSRAIPMTGERVSEFTPRPGVTFVQIRLVNHNTGKVVLLDINKKNLDYSFIME